MNLLTTARSASGIGALILLSCTPSGTTTPPPPVASVAPPPAGAVARSGPSHATAGDCPSAPPQTPLEYGACALKDALGRARSQAKVTLAITGDPSAAGVEVNAKAESYSIVSQGDETHVVGRDATGAMYGALDVAERLDDAGAAALPVTSPIKQAPVVEIRAANLFLVLKDATEKTWWFRETEFWTEYLDMMAKGRLNFLDMHGMYNLDNTVFPNALLYFATAASDPAAGVPHEEREANLAMLNKVIAMAGARGIKVALMSYRTDLDVLGHGKAAAPEEEPRVEAYTREAVADLATRAPGLVGLGFRIGESGRKPNWYTKTYVEGLKKSRSATAAYTRTWLTPKKDLLELVKASGPETIVEAKYNGEQLGAPYIISGGGMETWGSYSYQDFLDPPYPYRFVFQIRAGGTHRIFRYASYERTRRAVLALAVSPKVAGFTLEAAHAYSPQYDFYHADHADSFSPWTFRRDELSYALFGRLGYDPTTPESVFKAMLKKRVGTDALWDAVQAASDITPWVQTAFECGPDQRDYAAELELGGPVSYWASPANAKSPPNTCEKHHKETFDEFSVELPNEAATELLERRPTTRLSPVDVADIVLGDAKLARAASAVAVDPKNAEARDVVRECGALADLGEWFGHKLRGATALAVYEGSERGPWLDAARRETREADAAYTALANDTAYIAPFDERMRMRKQGLTVFHWKKLLPRLAEDMTSIDEAAQEAHASGAARSKEPLPDPKTWLSKPRKAGPGLVRLVVAPEDPRAAEWTLTVTLAAPAPDGETVNVLHRPFRSDGPDWAPVRATGSGVTWTAKVPGSGAGGMFAVEVVDGLVGWRYPDVLKETPYRPLAP